MTFRDLMYVLEKNTEIEVVGFEIVEKKYFTVYKGKAMNFRPSELMLSSKVAYVGMMDNILSIVITFHMRVCAYNGVELGVKC